MIVSFPIHDHLRDSVQAIHTGYSYTNIRGAQWHWATGMPSTFSVRYTPARFTSSPIKSIALLKYTEHTQRRKVEIAKMRYQNPAARRHPWRNLLRQKARNHFCNTGRPARQAHPRPCPGHSRPTPLRSLLPLQVDADQRAQGTRQTNEAIIKGNQAEGRQRDRQIAQVRSQLQLAGRALTTSSTPSAIATTPTTTSVAG
jgi:uncharacterized membrane protein YccC